MATSRRQFVRMGLAGIAAVVGGTGAVAGGPPSTPSARAAPTTAAEAMPQTTPPVSRKKLLILGGTGFLGPAIVRHALSCGHELTLFNRGKSRADLFPDVEKLHGDRDGDLKTLEGDRTWDAVIDTSGYVPRVVKMSANLLKSRVKQYIFISSISVYAQPPIGSDETARLEKLDNPATEDIMRYYGALKAACEQVIEDVYGPQAVNIRPGLIVGPEDPSDRYTYWPVRMDQGGDVLCPGDGNDPVQYIDVRDLGQWLVMVMENGLTGAFNAVGPSERFPIREMLHACDTAAGNKAKLVWVNSHYLDGQQVTPWADLPVWTGGLNGMCTINSARAINAGLTFRTPLQTAQDTLAWWKTLPKARQAKLQAGLKPEREAALLQSWRKHTK